MHRIRRRTHELLRPPKPVNIASRAVDVVILALIVANVLTLILESVASVYNAYGSWFWVLEALSVAVFSVEYLLRVWSSVEDPRFAGPHGWLRHLPSWICSR